MEHERIDWYRTKIDSEALRHLTRRSDLRGLLQAGSQLAIFVITAYGAWFAWNELHWGWFILALFVHGTFAQFLGIAAACHELSHGTPFKTKALNSFFYSLFSFISWNNPVWFRLSHKYHHQFTLHAPRDLEVVLPVKRTGWGSLLSLFVNPVLDWMSLTRHAQHAFGLIATPWEKSIFERAGEKKRRGLFRWARVLVFGHLALAIVFAAFGQWILIPILLWPMYASWLSSFCGRTQHDGLQSAVPDFRRCCRTVLNDPLTAYLYWQMNYHTEHHMFPAVPFFNLSKLHQLLQADGAPPPNCGLRDALHEIRMIATKQRETPGVAFDSFSRGKTPVFVPQEGA